MLTRSARTVALAAAGAWLLATAATALPTTITVHVIAKGAKFVGTSMAGARVTIRDADTGVLLASGLTSGSTGDTARIMKTPHGRPEVLSDPSAAAFTAILDLDRPTRIEVEAFGPLAERGSANRATSTQWVVPGKDITGGDAWLLELPGFAIQILAPTTHSRVSPPADLEIRANVTMMCGCPITPKGLWDADAIEVKALVRKDGAALAEIPLHYAGTASQFSGTLVAADPGVYELDVYAYDPRDGNTGVAAATVLVEP